MNKLIKAVVLILNIITFTLLLRAVSASGEPLDSWHWRNGGEFYGITYGNNTFVAVGYKSIIITSPDGVTWTKRSTGIITPLLSITYGSNTFVAVGENGVILTSPDGITWTERNSESATSLYGVAYGNNSFVAVGKYGIILTSPDGITWTERNSGTSRLLKNSLI